MKTIDILAQTGPSNIAIGETLQNLPNYTDTSTSIIITDTNLHRLYHPQFPPCPTITIGAGEKIKTLQTVEEIFQQLTDLEADRSHTIIGIGGGIVCDIAGFVASTYMRGLDFGFVSTSLLSQVDASVGGKNGVNFHGYKNMVGVFNQPRFVLCDTAMLNTLPHEELLSGFAEIVKHAAISSPDMFRFLEQNYSKALDLDIPVIEQLVYDSVVIKADIVRQDEREKGERRKLNFGHTLGHAVEKTAGISHGEAVGIGMVFAAQLSVHLNMLPTSAVRRIRDLLKSIGLPTEITGDKEKVLDALKKDKKREGKGIHFCLLSAIGEAVIREIPIQELEEVIDDMY